MRGVHFEQLSRIAQREHKELLNASRPPTLRKGRPEYSVFQLTVTDETFWFETVIVDKMAL
eukprot:10590072-Heterocapsa_arctica.AAC.1